MSNARIHATASIRPLRVLINGTPLLSPFTGIARYTRNLAVALMTTRELELIFFYGLGFSNKLREVPFSGIESSKRVFKALVPHAYEVKQLVQSVCFRARVTSLRADVYHETTSLPFDFAGPTVVTAHDLSWLFFPHTHPAERVRAMVKRIPVALEKAAHIITDAQSVRQEIVKQYQIEATRISAIPLAARDVFHPRTREECRPVLAKYRLESRRFLLCVGTLEPRKNLELALRAFTGLPALSQRSLPLVVVGMMGWLASDLEQLIDPLARAGLVRPLGYANDDELACLYASARMLIFPSLYEGFGLPPLEAMASGTPVITSNVSSLPEVVGDAGVQVDPHDVDGLRAAILRLAEDDAHWEALRSAGLARAAQFSWERCARETLAVYRKVLA